MPIIPPEPANQPDIVQPNIPRDLIPTVIDALQVRLDGVPEDRYRERNKLELLIAEMDDPGVVEWC